MSTVATLPPVTNRPESPASLLSWPVLRRGVRSRALTAAVAVLTLWALLLMTMAVYREMDTSVYDALPEGLRNAMGIPVGADSATLAFSVMLGTMGSLTLGGVAIAVGSGLLAGEEGTGTLRLVLSTPVRRRTVVLSKAAALGILIAAMILLLWATAALTPRLLGVDAGATRLGAMMLHLGLNTAFYGALAFAIGAWTGRRGKAVGLTALLMVLGFITVGLLPMFDTTKDLVRVIPWNWLDGHRPLLNGVHATDIALLAAGVVIFLALAGWGFERRDLVGSADAPGLLDRLRDQPLIRAYVERVGGRARVTSLTSKLGSEHVVLLYGIVVLMFGYLGVLVGWLYSVMADAVKNVGSVLPERMLAFFGGAPIDTPEGFIQTETLGLMAPAAVILVGTVVAVKGIAGHEAAGRLGLILGQPVSRARVIAAVATVMVGYVVAVAVATGAGITLGSVVGGLGMDFGHVAGTALLLALLGVMHAAVALVVAAGTGRSGLAVWVTVAVALVGHVVNAVFAQSTSLQWVARLSPFYYYADGWPLANGLQWSHAVVLAAMAAVLIPLSFWLFQRRDLRR